MSVIFKKMIEYPRDLHEKLVDLLAEEIGATKQPRSMNEFIVKILSEYADRSDGHLAEVKRQNALETMERAEKILAGASYRLGSNVVTHWVGVLNNRKSHSDPELNAQLDALIARFRKKQLKD